MVLMICQTLSQLFKYYLATCLTGECGLRLRHRSPFSKFRFICNGAPLGLEFSICLTVLSKYRLGYILGIFFSLVLKIFIINSHQKTASNR